MRAAGVNVMFLSGNAVCWVSPFRDSSSGNLNRIISRAAPYVGLDRHRKAAGGEIGAQPTPETAECVTVWTAPDSYLGQLARMYAIESGQPEISRIKREGLARFYGIEDGDGSEYFRVHEEADLAHADESDEHRI